MNGGVNVGATVVSDNPVQVDILTGDIGSTYESRDSGAAARRTCGPRSYYDAGLDPATAQSIAGTATTVWLYNPGASAAHRAVHDARRRRAS